MASPLSTDSKTVLDLALELGVRADAVLQVLAQMGIAADDAGSLVDPSLVPEVAQQMVSSGKASSVLAKGKGRRKINGEPLADDALMKEALGAGTSGFSESLIPRQILLETEFESPSLWKRWFGKKNQIAATLQEQNYSEEELQSLFTSRHELHTKAERSPFADDVEEIVSPLVEPSAPEDEETEATDEDMEIIEVDEELLHDLDEIEMEGREEELETETTEDLEELEELENLEGLDVLREMEEEEETEEEIPVEEPDDLEMPEEDHLEGTEDPLPEVFEPAAPPKPGFFERLFSKIHLSHAEMWAVMGGAILVMLCVLGFTIYWWLNYSEKAEYDLLLEAQQHFEKAKTFQEEWTRGERKWDTVYTEYQGAADLFETYMNKFKDDPRNMQTAFRELCECYYQIATGFEKNGETNKMEEPYRRMEQLYGTYLAYLDQLADRMVSSSDNRYLAFPATPEQKVGLTRIALANRKLQNFDVAIQKYKQLVKEYPKSEEAYAAQQTVAETYQDWSKINKEEEIPLLQNAMEEYKYLLDPANGLVPEEDHLKRMNVYIGMGDIKSRLSDISEENDKPEEAKLHLQESMAFYEKAEEEIRKAEDIPFDEKVRVFQRLADLYLLKGRETGRNWKDFEEVGNLYADGLAPKQQLLDRAEQEHKNTIEFLGKSQKLFDELLENKDALKRQTLYDILYNKAESSFILRDYPQTLAAQAELDDVSRDLSNTHKAKIHYLLGHAAWEMAKETDDYTPVKEFYRKALELDNLYPQDQKGEISHLAEIRLTNAYFMRDSKYEEAIARFESAIKNYPDTGYTYLTLYFYGKALNDYGDVLTNEADRLELESKQLGESPDLLKQAQEKRNKAKDLFETAVSIFDRAVDAREKSRYVDAHHKEYLTEIVFKRGLSAYKAGNYREAEKKLQEALEQNRNAEIAAQYIPLTIETLAKINDNLGNYPKAIQYYLEYLRNAYEDTEARVTLRLADAYLKQFSFDKGRIWLNRILQNYRVPDQKDVELALRKGIKLNQGPGFQAMKKIAESYAQQAYLTGDRRKEYLQKALEVYQDLINRFPLSSDQKDILDDVDSLQKIGGINYELGNYAEAAKNYEALLALAPDVPRKGQIHYRIGGCYMQLQQWEAAVNALSNVDLSSMENEVQYADALILMGQAYEALANEYLKNADDKDMFVLNMEKARQTYEQVGNTNVKEKIIRAGQLRNAIDIILKNQRELATANPAKE